MPLLAQVGRQGLQGMRPPAPRAPTRTLCVAVWLCAVPLCVRLGHLGLEGTHPLAPRGPISYFWCSHQAACGAAAGTVGAPGARRDASRSPKGAVSVGAECLAARKHPSGRPVADLPPPPRGRLCAHSPVHDHARCRGGGHDARECTRKRGSAPPYVPQDCRVAGCVVDFLVFSLPDLLAPPSPPLQGLEGQAMETISLAEDEVL